MKSGKRQLMEGIELPNQEKVSTPSAKKQQKTYKYSGILEADTTKQAEMIEKKKDKKNSSGKRENHSKLNDIAEILSEW